MKAKQLKRIEEANNLRAMSTQGISVEGGNSSSPKEEKPKPPRPEPSRRLSAAISEMVGLGNPDTDKLHEHSKMQRLMLGAWEGVDLTSMMSEDIRKEFSSPVRQAYHDLSHKANWLVENNNFVNFVTAVILGCGVLVGAQTYDGWKEVENEETGKPLCETTQCEVCLAIDQVILAIFTFEIVAKFVAADHAPLSVLRDPWNAFDFVIVLLCLPIFPTGGVPVAVLRLLRLLRVLKLVKAFPQLQVIVKALMMGMASIGYIGVILLLVFYGE